MMFLCKRSNGKMPKRRKGKDDDDDEGMCAGRGIVCMKQTVRANAYR